MRNFEVWAPIAERVELQLGSTRAPMMRERAGWWGIQVETQGSTIDYGFVLDGRGPFPDPRSPWQPNGVHGLSRWVEHADFSWNDAGFKPRPFAEAVLYELHVGTFTPAGTFLAAIDKLDHLSELGITHVELMPLAAFPGKFGWGYDGVGLFAPHSAYGTPQDLKRLVSACHSRGLAVILDVVYNHLGPSGNYLGHYGPYFTARYANPWGPSFNFDGPDCDEVRRFFCDNALYWLREFHMDGLRLDAVHAMMDASALHLLEQLAAEVRQFERKSGRKLVLIAESDLNTPRILWPSERGGFGLDAQWNDDFHHALHALLTREQNGYYADFGSLASLAKSLAQGFVYDGCYSKHRRRRFGRPAEGVSGEQFVAYLQNHDQVANRSEGERTGRLLGEGRLRIGAALVLLGPFVPMLFQGEEWGTRTPFFFFADHQESSLIKAVRQGRRRELAALGWKTQRLPDPDRPCTFRRSKLDWTELAEATPQRLLKWFRRLIRLRQAERSLWAGDLGDVQVRFDEPKKWLILERGSFSILCNFADTSQGIPIRSGRHRLILSSASGGRIKRSEALLKAESVLILRRDSA